ncbi:unnamed protein product, partial [marine sediment metagenome]
KSKELKKTFSIIYIYIIGFTTQNIKFIIKSIQHG